MILQYIKPSTQLKFPAVVPYMFLKLLLWSGYVVPHTDPQVSVWLYHVLIFSYTSAVVGMFFPYRHVGISRSRRRHDCWHNSSFKIDRNTWLKTVKTKVSRIIYAYIISYLINTYSLRLSICYNVAFWTQWCFILLIESSCKVHCSFSRDYWHFIFPLFFCRYVEYHIDMLGYSLCRHKCRQTLCRPQH